MSSMAYQITSITIVYSTVYSFADQRKHQSSASLAFVWGFHHRWPVNSPHKGRNAGKKFPFDDVIMQFHILTVNVSNFPRIIFKRGKKMCCPKISDEFDYGGCVRYVKHVKCRHSGQFCQFCNFSDVFFKIKAINFGRNAGINMSPNINPGFSFCRIFTDFTFCALPIIISTSSIS